MATTQPHDSAATTHVVGTMDSSEQQRTFNGFVRFMVWAAGLSIAVVVFLALANA